MISLVTQSDGSARRLPVVSLAIAIGMAVLFFGSADEMSRARTEAGFAMADALEYFEEYPYVELPDGMDPYLPAERAEELRAAHAADWQDLGGFAIPDRLRSRVQKEFDALVEPALAQFDALPVNAHAYRGSGGAKVRYFDHVLYHGTASALLLSILALLLFGFPLEDVWGSFGFAAFCAVLVPVGAMAFGALHPTSATLWIGGSGLAAGLLGATAARWFHSGSPRLLGAIPLAAWWLVPAWFVAEYGSVRGIRWESIGTAPIVVHASIVGVGFVLALVYRVAGIEQKLGDRWDDSKEPVRNPRLEQAMQLREQGERDEAMTLLRACFDKKPDPDVSTAMWDVAKELGTPEVGVAAALWRVRDALRRKQKDVAREFWSEIVSLLDQIEAEPPLFVKLAELELAAGAEDDANQTLERLLRCGTPIPGAVALRAAALVADSASEFASRIAMAGIEGGSASKSERGKLQKFVAPTERESFGDGAGEHRSAGGGCSASEPLRVKTRVLPAFQGLRAKPSEPLPTGEFPEPEPEPGLDLPAADAPYASQDDTADVESLDPNALSLDALDDELGELTEESANDSSASGLDAFDYGAIDLGADPELGVQMDTAATGAEIHIDGLEANDEPVASDTGETESWNSPGVVEDLSAPLPGLETGVPVPQDGAAIEPRATSLPPLGAIDVGDDPAARSGRQTLPILDDAPAVTRDKKRIGAVPISLAQQRIGVDVEGKGKTVVPLKRVEAVAVGAVRELGEKPVVLIDLILNWSGDPSEPLKVLRIRSDAFDPRMLVPGSESSIAALRGFIAALIDGARPECLPDHAAAHGTPFSVYDTVEAYEQAAFG